MPELVREVYDARGALDALDQQAREKRKITTRSESGTPSNQAIPYLTMPSSPPSLIRHLRNVTRQQVPCLGYEVEALGS
jgi:hypothetical protein